MAIRTCCFRSTPPLLHGCPRTSTPEMQYPLEIAFDYGKISKDMFLQPRCPASTAGRSITTARCRTLSLGEGGTALVASSHGADWIGLKEPIWLKDESRNPTWSHKDRLNYCIVSRLSRRARLGSRLHRAEITALPRPLTRAGPVCVASSFPVRVRRRLRTLSNRAR